MTKQTKLTEDDRHLFKSSLIGVKKIKQDTVRHLLPIPDGKTASLSDKHTHPLTENDSFYFSDEYQPLLKEDPVSYLRPDADTYELKKLRRGFYQPELFLDLHGLTQQEAKKELGALIAACRQEHIQCASVLFGHGKHILKKQTPLWLAQHPDVLCFHQAPKEFGGSAGLLILLDIPNQ